MLLAAVALALPFIAPDPATTNIAVFTVMYVGLATAWNIMGGYTGYISLGHAAFFGFGAYALGLMLQHLHVAPGYLPFLLVPIAGALTAIVAVGIGWVALRTRAATFVIVTIAFMFIMQLLAENLVKLTGGGAGLAFPVPLQWWRFLQHAVLLRHAGAGRRSLAHLVVDPSLEVRPRPAGDPRR
jgi:branched-chain amino acid transport system permease protein